MPSLGAVIVAAGSGVRMGGIDKVFASLSGRPIIAHTLAVFQACGDVQSIVLVLSAANLQRGRDLVRECGFDKVGDVCPGGERRQDSVRLGLEQLPACDYVAVHDGPRALVTAELIERGLEVAQETGAAVPALPLSDTVKEAGPDGLVVRTLDRSRLWAVQTPQIFRYDLLLRAHREVTADPSTSLRTGFTDDASMLEALSVPVKLYAGSRTNIKITAPEDMEVAEALLSALGGAGYTTAA